MTLEEILKENGIEEDSIKKITAAMKENKIFTSAQENLDLRYGKLNDKYKNLETEKTTLAQQLEELKNSANLDETLKTQVVEKDSLIKQLQEQLSETKVNNALSLRLLKEGADDIDYLMYKASKTGELKLNENGEIENLDNIIETLKTASPNQFGNSTKQEVTKKYEEKPLPKSEEEIDSSPKTLEDAIKQMYEQKG